MKSRLFLPIVVAAVVAAVVGACSSTGGTSPSAVPSASHAPSVAPSESSAPSAAAVELTVFAAASLTGVMDRVKAAYEATNAGTSITVSPDSSAALGHPDPAGCPGRRVPVRRYEEPAGAR